MLEDRPWINYAHDLCIEWQQSKDEGKLVEYLKDICTEISIRSKKEDCAAFADEIGKKMKSAPVDFDYPYNEPSDLNGIRAVRPSKRHVFSYPLSADMLIDKITGAWIGRISGCLLGKPVESYRTDKLYQLLKCTNNYPMNRYITADQISKTLAEEAGIDLNSCWADTINGMAPIDDDTNYPVLALKLIETYGVDFRPNDVLEAWLRFMPMLSACTAERIAYRNAAAGMLAPETAIYHNPYREWIGAQIRGDFFGYINPGNPEKAAELAWRDASISHVKNGIYGEMFISAMIAAAAVCKDVVTVIEAGLDEIPLQSRLRRDIDFVLDWFYSGFSSEKTIENIHKIYNEYEEHHWCHTNSNAMVVVMALLYGGSDFGKTVCLAVQAAFDTDCNGATAGSIIGMMIGANHIPPYWMTYHHNKLSTTILGYTEVTVSELVKKTFDFVQA